MKLYGQVKGRKRHDVQPLPDDDNSTMVCPHCRTRRKMSSYRGQDGRLKRTCRVCRKKGYYK